MKRRPIPSSVKGPTWTGSETPADPTDPVLLAARRKFHAYCRKHGLTGEPLRLVDLDPTEAELQQERQWLDVMIG